MQRSLFKTLGPEFGGSLGKGKRKERRPITTKRPMHVVFRASVAKGDLSFRRPANLKLVKRVLQEETAKRKVRVLSLSINSNHLHLLLQGKTREGIQNFLRVFAGRVAQAMTKAWKGHALKRRFWDELVFTRIVEWGKAFRTAAQYVVRNELEALGVIPYVRTSRRRFREA